MSIDTSTNSVTKQLVGHAAAFHLLNEVSPFALKQDPYRQDDGQTC